MAAENEDRLERILERLAESALDANERRRLKAQNEQLQAKYDELLADFHALRQSGVTSLFLRDGSNGGNDIDD